ncbi:MAG: hypothetical protein JXA13_07895 [Anaerolineales bacterium]|nr:hypothetical protein [Anaerolineales bacterium]
MTDRNGRIILFSGLVFIVLMASVSVHRDQAKPLYDDNVQITKDASPAEFSQAGEVITYTYTVTNTSGYDMESIQVTDDLVDVSCPKNALNVSGCGRSGNNSSMTCTGSYVITDDDVAAGQVVNQASVTGVYRDSSGCDSQYYNASASTSKTITLVQAALPSIELKKTASPNAFMGPGEIISYTYEVTNTGDLPLSGSITISDDMVDVSCPGGGLEIGASLECVAKYTTTMEDVVAGKITNHASASIGGAAAEDSATIELQLRPAVELTKSAEPTSFTRSGTLITFLFEVTNTGNVYLEPPFELHDSMLDQWSCPTASLKPGESLVCTGYYTVQFSDLERMLNNCASITAQYFGGSVTSSTTCTDVFFQPPPPKLPEPEPEPEHECEPWPECNM